MPSATSGLPSPADIVKSFEQIAQVLHAKARPLPTQTGDLSYLDENPEKHVLQQLKALNFENLDTLKDALVSGIDGKPLDDKKYLMERVIKIASELPVTSTSGTKLTDGFLSLLWNDLQHPPLSYLGTDYKYRKADGSNNNIRWPQIGVAGAPYARTVKPETIQPISLPDPGLLFDSLMVRRKFKEHPTKISSVLFYVASIIIHDIFHTSHEDFSKSETSSYLDLAPLYGSKQEQQDLMRTFKDGKIKADCFSDERILGFPPGVGLLLIMFNRFHNYIVEQLALIDENGRFSSIRNPPGRPAPPNADVLYDDALFQTGRLITTGLYINIILKDYVRTILNLNRTNSAWDLDPRSDSGKTLFGAGTPQATGNQVSAEFNLVYRWHSCISKKDEKWSIEAYRAIVGDKPPANLSDFLLKLRQWAAKLPKEPEKRPFANLKRGSDGSFADDDLAAILTASIDDPAGAYGANNVPEVLRDVEILGIIQARSWNLASLNEFRKYFNLEPHRTFEDINPDPEVADALKHLYDHPDFVELYPGIAVESAKKPLAPGSGLCTTFTISRAILSDAVSLVRGDRFYTIDYTAKNLTNFGFNIANYDLTVDNGCVFYKLILRAFPNNYRPNSVYAHYPLVVPEENQKILKDLGTADAYDFSTPATKPDLIMINSYEACRKILDDKTNFNVTWGKDSIEFLMQHSGKPYARDFMLSGDSPVNLQSRQLMQPSLYMKNWEKEVASFYEKTTLDLLHRNSYRLAGSNQVDIVRDVSNLAQVHFAASVFSLSLKTEDNPRGVYSEAELYTVLAVVFICIFYDADPASSFPIRQAARSLTQQLGQLVELNVECVSKTGFVATLVDNLYKHDALTDYGIHLIQRLLKSGVDAKDIVWTHMLPTCGGMVANQSQVFSQTLDYYLSEEGKVHLPEIYRLAHLDTPEADDLLTHYFLEGSRLASGVALYRDIAVTTKIEDNGESINLPAGHRLLCNLRAASRDPHVFPEPDKIILNRDRKLYIHYGWGPHQCLGYGLSVTALTTMLKTVGKLKNLRRAPGPQGEIKEITLYGMPMYMTADERSYWPFPSTMKIQWDGPLP